MDDRTRNALATLDLEPGSSLADVKKSYRELALIWHPDKVPERVKDRATVKFTQINDAYQWLLRNPDRLKASGGGREASGGAAAGHAASDRASSGRASSRRRPPPGGPSASGYGDAGSSRTRSSRAHTGGTGEPVAQRILRAARGLRTDPVAGLYIFPDVDADRAANFIVSLRNNVLFREAAATVADLLVFYDIDGTGEEGMAVTRSNRLINNNVGTLHDIGDLAEVRLKEGFLVPWGEIEVRRRGRRTFESAGYAEKAPGRALAGILQNLVDVERT